MARGTKEVKRKAFGRESGSKEAAWKTSFRWKDNIQTVLKIMNGIAFG